MTPELLYDPLGRLFQTSGGEAGTTQFLYDGDELVAEYGNAGNVPLRRYVHGAGVDDPVAVYEGPNNGFANRRYHQGDPQGSVVALINADGTTHAINAYNEYGVPKDSNVGRFQYTGQAWIPELGMYYYKARFYSPLLGRFLQVDPIGYDGGNNIYSYAGADPVNEYDPDGLCRDRDADGKCVVRNEAGSAGDAATAALQAKLREIDPKIQKLGNDETISVQNLDGEEIGEMAGSELKRLWKKSRWTITPPGTNHGNGSTGGTYKGPHVKLNADGFEKQIGWAVKFGGTTSDGAGTVILHELSHRTRFGKGLTSQFPLLSNPQGTPGYDIRETKTSSAGRSIAERLGEKYVCGIFFNGCY